MTDVSRGLVERLREAAREIAREGHNGWGNTCTDAADALEASLAREERLKSALTDLIGVAGLNTPCWNKARAALGESK